ncbi:glutamate--tRNA ligase [Candidatus Woesearchaeota archaeon]|nr:glutamate--tRNA ligase [Candidatus Woesearchaeota archaeon]
MNKDLIYALALENAIKFNGRASQSSVTGILISISPSIKSNIKEASKLIAKIIEEVNSMSLQEQKEKYEKLKHLIHHEEKQLRIGLPELKNAENLTVRFAPFPSGPLHIGNAKQLVLNDEYSKTYNGKFLLVFDDTIGSEEKTISKEAYSLILDGVKWLDVKIDSTYYKSDRLEIYYKYALELVKENKAYVCFCRPEELRKNREKGLECSHRNYSIKENLEFWNQLLKKKFKPSQATLRIKTSMQHKNPAFRDRVLFRISKRSHPRTKNKYTIWPLLEFSWAIDDHLLGVSHIIRGKDLMMESEMEQFIWNIFNWANPEIIHTGLVNIKGIKLSKSKSKEEVQSGFYKGWDDPRTWSLQSLRKRGIKPKAIRNFLLKSGLSKNDVTVPIEDLYAENRALIEKESNRYFFVQDPKLIKIQNFKGRDVSLNLHPDIPERGKRKLKVKNSFYINKKDFDVLREKELYRLMDCLNFTKQKNKFMFHSLDYESYKEKGSRIMHWLPEQGNLKASVIMDNYNIINGLLEKNASKMKINEICQFERTFFAKLDKKTNNVLLFYFTHK